MASSQKIDVKEAVKNANESLRAFYPGVENANLEEVELDEPRSLWLITLSFPDEEDKGGPVSLYARQRKYKIFQISAKDGSVVGMKSKSTK
ncbi:MAG: hypothetical protein AB7K37_11630 [Cyclobacteriaceae bacterium]